MRMSMRRVTRLTNGFSKKLENHGHAMALYFLHYNFCRVHKTLRATPAMEAGIADHVWTLGRTSASWSRSRQHLLRREGVKDGCNALDIVFTLLGMLFPNRACNKRRLNAISGTKAQFVWR